MQLSGVLANTMRRTMSRRLRRRQAAIDAKRYHAMDDALINILSIPLPPPVTTDFEFQELEKNEVTDTSIYCGKVRPKIKHGSAC